MEQKSTIAAKSSDLILSYKATGFCCVVILCFPLSVRKFFIFYLFLFFSMTLKTRSSYLRNHPQTAVNPLNTRTKFIPLLFKASCSVDGLCNYFNESNYTDKN